MSEILWTRWGGNVQLFMSEVNSGGTASLDHWMAKSLCEMGHRIHIFGNLSKKGRDELRDNPENWHKNLIFHPDPTPSVPDYITHVFVSQGTENFRFGGVRGIPSQLWVYRLIRDCKVPVIYQQYDAYTPIYHNPWLRTISSLIWGLGIREMCKSRLFIWAAGTNKSEFIKANYDLAGGHPKVIMWDKDAHQVAAPGIDLFGLEPKKESDVIPGICFIGKHRRSGSRGDELLELDRILKDFPDPNFKLHLYGKWDSLFDGKNESDYPRIENHGRLKGGDKVIEAYNNYEFALIAGNERYKKFNQYTIRVFEVIESGTIPIIEREWFKCWKGIFPDGMSNYLEANFCYDRLEDIPNLIMRIRKLLNGNRVLFSNKIRKNLRSVLSDEYVRNNLKNLLEDTERYPEYTREQADDMARKELDSHLEYWRNHKVSRIRNSAVEIYNMLMNFEFNSDYYKAASLNTDDFKNHYCFQLCNYSNDEIVKMFGRTSNQPS